MITVLSAGLRTASSSRLLAQEALRALTTQGQPARLLDLRDYPLPLCDGDTAYEHPQVARLGAALRSTDALLVATPIYNYAATAALKNVIELTGDAWENKVVGFLCAAGGTNSYMSIMSLANSLMLDFRSVVVPRFVYATEAAFADGRLRDPEVARRIAELTETTARLGAALRPATAASA